MAEEPTCRTCDQHYNQQKFPFCSYCGSLLIELDELDLSPNADMATIYKKPKIEHLQ